VQQSQHCDRDPWIDLTEFHKNLRTELENLILDYINSSREKYYTPIIVAPYGSGKTTLLRHLLCYSLSNGIPAIKVNLSSLVNYLSSQGINRIDEDNLPGYFSKFCIDVINNNSRGEWSEYDYCCLSKDEIRQVLERYRNDNNVKCILLIDEIEEQYDEFRRIIKYKTTPFRGLFDMIYEGKSRVFTILAFGPSSIYSEAVSGPGTWRTKTYPIPIIYPSKITEGITDNEIGAYLANWVWWLGKGRIALVYKIIDNFSLSKQPGVNRDVISKIINADDPKTEIAGLFEQLKSIKIVENVPFYDRDALDELLNTISDPLLNKLFRALVILIGPVPESLLAKFLNNDEVQKLRYQRLDTTYFLKSDKLIEVDELIEVIKGAVKSIGKELDEYAKDLLRSIFQAWGDHKYLILSKEALEDLFEIIKGLSVEFYKPEIYDILNSLDLDQIYNDLTEIAESRSSQLMSSKKQYYYALRPSVIGRVYPPIILTPIFSCSKKQQIDQLKEFLRKELGKLSAQELIGISDNVLLYIERVLKISQDKDENQGKSVRENAIIVFVPSINIGAQLKVALLRELIGSSEGKGSKRKIVLIPLPLEESHEAIINELRKDWEHFINVGIADVLYLGDKATLFIMSLLYNMLNRDCLSKLDRNEENLVSQYATAVYKIIKDAVKDTSPIRITDYIKPDIKKLRDLKNKAHSVVGEDNAKYLWLIESSSDADILKDYLKVFADSLLNINNIINSIITKSNESILSGVSLLINNLVNDHTYFKDLAESWKNIKDSINNLGDKSIIEVLNELVSVACIDAQYRENIIDLLDEIYDYIRNTIEIDNEVLKYELIWYVLQSTDKCEISKYMETQIDNICDMIDKLKGMMHIIDSTEYEIRELEDKINEIISNSQVTELGFIKELKELSNNLENLKTILEEDICKKIFSMNCSKDVGISCDELKEQYDELIPYLKGLNNFEKSLFLQFEINKVIMTVIENLDQELKRHIQEVMSNIGSVTGEINRIIETISSVESIDKNAADAIRKDIEEILQRSGMFDELMSELKELERDIRDLEEALNTRKDTIDRLNRLKGEIEGFKTSLKTKTLGDSYDKN
jgi:prefoldin subunit 5